MFRLVNAAGRAALSDGTSWWDLARLAGDDSLAEPIAAVARFEELHALTERAAGRPADATLAGTRLGAPVPRPWKAFGIGLNYRAHAAETGSPLPPAPLTFPKFTSCIAGPNDDIELSGDTVDWEVELVVVIGRRGRRIPVGSAWGHVAGLTLGQDVSDRTLQRTGTPAQFGLGKSYDGYGPTGPALVSVDAFPDRDDIGLTCDVAGERMQDGRTSDLIFPVAELVSYLSGVCTLEPGDLIFTGTPSGVGAARKRFLRPGEVIVSSAEVIGTMTNRCVAGGQGRS